MSAEGSIIPMNQHFITQIHIDHVRHLHNIDILLSDTTCKHLILTGKNGSGKTSVVEALAKYLSLFMEKTSTINLVLANRYEWVPKTKEKLSELDPDKKRYHELKESLQSSEDLDHKYFQGVTAIFHNKEFVIVNAGKGKYLFAYYSAEREYSAANEKNIEKVELKDSYSLEDHPGQNFVKYILNLKTIGAMAAQEGKTERAEEIKIWFKNFDAILQRIFDDSTAHLDFNIETFEFHILTAGHEPFSFDALSSGYAAILDIVVDLMMRMEKNAGKHYDLEGVVLIDEIEPHLHLALQKNIMPILTGLFPNLQFIITTHSPFILSSVPDAVIYDLANKTLVNSTEGLSNVPYDGIVEGYFNVSNLSNKLKEKYERYKEFAAKENLTDDDEVISAATKIMQNSKNTLPCSY